MKEEEPARWAEAAKVITAEKIRLSSRQHVSLEAVRRAELSSWEDHCARSLVLSMETYIHGIAKERISVHKRWPKDWWQAFKDRWFPAWALKRWPVQWETIDIDQQIYQAVCPHIQDDPQSRHLQFLCHPDVGKP